jgi:excisionase family DNA binding protein
MNDALPDIDETCLYRHFDKANILLYVGVSLSALNRLAQHRVVSEWFGQIHRVEIERFSTRREALEAERNAISGEKPLHNIKGLRHKKPAPTGPRLRQINGTLFAARVSATVGETCQATGLGKTTVYELINAGTIETVAVGTRRLVLVRSVLELIDPAYIPTHNPTHKLGPVSGELVRTTAAPAARVKPPDKRLAKHKTKQLPSSANI